MTYKPIGVALAVAVAAGVLAQTPPSETLDLQRVAELTLRHNPRLAAMRAEAVAARAGVRMNSARKGPQLSLNGFATSGTQNSIVASSPGVMPEALMMVPGERNFLDLNAMLMVPIYTGGILESAVRSASALARSVDAEVQEMEGEAVLMAQESYLRVVLGDRFVEAAEAQVAAASRMVEDAKTMLEAGRGIEASVRRAEAELGMAQKELAVARANRDKARVEMLARIGIALDSLPDVAKDLGAVPQAESLEAYVAGARQRRGLVLAARSRLAAAEADVRRAEGSLKPQVYGFAMGDLTNQEMMERGHTLGITVSLPVFDSGERRAEIARMRAMRDAAKASVATAELQVESEVRVAWLDLRASREGLAAAQGGLVSAQAAFDVMQVRVESGRGIAVELLDALAALSRARIEVAESEFMVRMALLGLDRAAGSLPARQEVKK